MSTKNESTEMKFTTEELQSLQELQDKYQQKQNLLGQISVQQILLNQQQETLEKRMSEVEQEYVQLQQEELTLVNTLNEKYGQGSLNPETGVFTPNT